MSSNENTFRQRVYKFYSENLSKGKHFTVLHFRAEGAPKRTIYDILKRYDDGLPAERQVGSGRPAKIFTKKKSKQLEKDFQNNDKFSMRRAAQKYDASVGYVHKTVTKKLKMKYRKKKTIPDRSEEQTALAQTKCGRLHRKFATREFVLDDESYFTFSHSRITGNEGFYTKDVSTAPADVKYTKKRKFEQKVLVWIAMSPKGLSRALIKKSGYAINANRYLKECIQRRLVPFLRQHYVDGEYIFWPDQASAHYAKKVIDFLKAENIAFVDKSCNPAGVPEIRPIEDFWAFLKRKVYARGWKAKTHQQLIKRVRYCLKTIDMNVVQSLALSTKSRIDSVRRTGVVEKQV